MDELIVMHPHNGILLGNEKKWPAEDTDGSRKHHAGRKDPDRKAAACRVILLTWSSNTEM